MINQTLYQLSVLQHINLIIDLIPVNVAPMQMPSSVLALRHSKPFPAVHHPHVVEDSYVPLIHLVLHHELFAVAERVEQLECSVQSLGQICIPAQLRTPHLIVESHLSHLPRLVKPEGWETVPLVELSRVLCISIHVKNSCIPEMNICFTEKFEFCWKVFPHILCHGKGISKLIVPTRPFILLDTVQELYPRGVGVEWKVQVQSKGCAGVRQVHCISLGLHIPE